MKKYKLKIRSKNHTASKIRGIVKSPHRAVLRLGSITPTEAIFPNIPIEDIIEINTPEGCKISGNKILMKRAFEASGVKTADWKVCDDIGDWDIFPAIIKHKHSSKGNGIFYIKDQDDLDNFKVSHQDKLNNYIIEKYFSYSREYRLHVTAEGCFYTCRKMLREEAEERWHRHDNNCVWILEENPLFDKPNNWEEIVAECVKALTAVSLDIAAVDIKVQSATNKQGVLRESPEFIILETNSAPSLGDITANKYVEQLTNMLN
jgi:glutathione synthase/RimK-type ligase-like ATP-grasp enzyme